MSSPGLPLVLEPEVLEQELGSGEILLVDLCRREVYASYHIPGAVYLDYAQLVAARPPAMGLVPDAESLSATLASIGLTPNTHVVAYDDEGGGKAARLLWTLEAIGHPGFSLLNGGLHAWANEGHRLEQRPTIPTPSDYRAGAPKHGIADRDYVLARLEDPGVRLLDARSPEEYRGARRSAERGGHIPGAVSFPWTDAMDTTRNLRLQPAEALRDRLERLGVTEGREVIVYCQTHHRSAHTYVVLRWLGFPRVKAYPGSWSEWGNDPRLPVE